MENLIQQKKKNRFLYLKNVYESGKGSVNAVFDMYEVGQELGFSEEGDA